MLDFDYFVEVHLGMIISSLFPRPLRILGLVLTVGYFLCEYPAQFRRVLRICRQAHEDHGCKDERGEERAPHGEVLRHSRLGKGLERVPTDGVNRRQLTGPY